MLRQNSLFSNNEDISPQTTNKKQQTINFICEDPCFDTNINKKNNSPYEGAMLSQSEDNPAIFYVKKCILDLIPNARWGESNTRYTSIDRTLVVEDDGKISIFNDSNKVNESIDEYLYNSAIRALYNSVIATKFYTPVFVHHDRLRISHFQAGDKEMSVHPWDRGDVYDNKHDKDYFIEFFRNSKIWYCNQTLNAWSSRGGLIHIEKCNAKEIIDFHNTHIEPHIAVSANMDGNTQEDYFFTLKALPSLEIVEEKNSSLRF